MPPVKVSQIHAMIAWMPIKKTIPHLPIMISAQSGTSRRQDLQKTFATLPESNISKTLLQDKIVPGSVNRVLSIAIVRMDAVQQWNLMVSRDAVNTAMMSSETHSSKTLEDQRVLTRIALFWMKLQLLWLLQELLTF